MPPPAATVPDMEDNHEEADFFMMPERAEDWPDFFLELLFRPIPFPDHVEGNDRNEFMNTSKRILFSLVPAGQPRQLKHAAEVAADEDHPVEPGTVRRSASAQINRVKAPQNVMLRRGGEDPRSSCRHGRPNCRRGTR